MIQVSSEMEEDRLKRRLHKILETRLETEEDTINALKHISTFFGINTLSSRRDLRCKIEKRSVMINQDFLKAFNEVKRSLDAACNDLDALSNSVQLMKNDLESSKSLTQNLIKQTNILQEERGSLETLQETVEAFLSHFQLSVSQHQVLYGHNKDEPIVEEFFNVLDYVQSIYNTCRILMQCGCQTVASDVMAEMALHQECGLERLYRWTQSHCRNLENSDIGLLLVKAMSRLQDRPVLFKYVVDEYAISRRSVLVRSFIEALTGSGASGNSRPIEVNAHDPKRYIGDTFAWLHQAILSEKENLSALLKQCDKNDLSEQIQQALTYIADGVCHPLKVRVETILNNEKDTIVLFALSNLLRFYQQTIKQLGQCGNLEQCLIDLQKTSEEVYLNSLAMYVRDVLQKSSGSTAEPPQRDLLPPSSLRRLLNFLKEILSVATMVDDRQADILKIVGCVIDPLLRFVQESAAHLPTVDMAVYLLNCLYQMQSTLAVYEYMDEWMEHLKAQSEAQIDTLIAEQASFLVANLQLNPIYTLLQTTQNKIETNLLKIFMTKMNDFLEMPDILLLPQIQLIVSATHRSTVQKRSFSVIVAIYKQIYERLHDPGSGFGHTENVFSKTPEQVAYILEK